MSGCGDTWFSKKGNAICFEPVTDKDLDRLEELLQELKSGGYEHRITKVRDTWFVTLENPKE